MKKKSLIAFIVSLFILLGLAGCGGEPLDLSGAAGGEEREPTKVPRVTIAPTIAVAQNLFKPKGEEPEEIRTIVKDELEGRVAFNAPEEMAIDESLEILALVSPLANPQGTPFVLETQIDEPGKVITSTLKISKEMKATLISENPDAFLVQAIDKESQVLLDDRPTHWRWVVTARKAGQYKLYLSFYRMVEYDGKEYWPDETYTKEIVVNTAAGQADPWIDLETVEAVVTIIGGLITITGAIFAAFKVLPRLWKWVQRKKTPPDTSPVEAIQPQEGQDKPVNP